MKKNTKLGIVCLLATAFSAVSFAAESPSWEIWTGSLGSFSWSNELYGSRNQPFTNIQLLNLTDIPGASVGVGYIIGTTGLEVKLNPFFSSKYTASGGASGGTTNTGWGATLGLNYSFMSEHDNSFYVEAWVGLGGVSSSTTPDPGYSTGATSKFMWGVSVGKRFNLVSHVNWVPMIGVSSITTYYGATTSSSGTVYSDKYTTVTYGVNIVPIQFTYTL